MNFSITNIKGIEVTHKKTNKVETDYSITDEELRFGKYTESAICEICGKKYNSHMRTLYIQYTNDESDIKCCCPECWQKEAQTKPHRYTNHIPAFCEGGRLITRLFDTKEDLIGWLKNTFANENDVLCYGDTGAIVIVNKNENFWWVKGFSTLSKGDLSNSNSEMIAKYHGKV
jgi:hypothetical protein